MVLRALHLCSGYGGFELALRGIARTVCHVERDSYAAATLVARMDEARLDRAPIWSDLCTFDAVPWRGRVDIVTAGLPCQPFSAAGQRRGLDDERHLWPHARRIIAEVGPRFVFLENVPDVVRAGWLGGVLGDLAEVGFDAEWGLLSAAAVGAPHKRERFWLVAHHPSVRRGEWSECTQQAGLPANVEASGRLMAHASSSHGTPSERTGDSGTNTYGSGNGSRRPHDVADTQGARSTGRRQPCRVGKEHAAAGGVHRFPPRPDDTDGWADYIATGGPEPGVRRGTDGPPAWLADALHLGGNGLVPQCAREAWNQLTERLRR